MCFLILIRKALRECELLFCSINTHYPLLPYQSLPRKQPLFFILIATLNNTKTAKQRINNLTTLQKQLACY